MKFIKSIVLFIMVTLFIYSGVAMSEVLFTQATKTTTGTTTAISSGGNQSIVYILKATGIDSFSVKLEGTWKTNFGWCNLATDNDDSLMFKVSKRDSLFAIRYDGQIPFTRLRICSIFPDTMFATTDTTIYIGGYWEDK